MLTNLKQGYEPVAHTVFKDICRKQSTTLLQAPSRLTACLNLKPRANLRFTDSHLYKEHALLSKVLGFICRSKEKRRKPIKKYIVFIIPKQESKVEKILRADRNFGQKPY